MSAYERAWWGVFLTTIAAGPVSAFVVLLIQRVQGANASPWGSLSATWLVVSAYAAIASAIVGSVGATICAGIIRRRRLQRTLPFLFLATVVAESGAFILLWIHGVGMLVFGPILIVVVQVIASFLVRGRRHAVWTASESQCASCGYSLVGLDRAKTTVCPECGEALPVNGVAPASHAPRHPQSCEAEEEEKEG
jgi:hypothetical protein